MRLSVPIAALLAASVAGAQPAAVTPAIEKKTPPAVEPPASGNEVFVYHSLIDPKAASDIFGRRIGKRYIAFQVIVTNRSKDLQYLMHDLSIAFETPDGQCRPVATGACELSSHDLTLMRGVAEKGQAYDARNLVFRALTGAGTLAAALIGIPVGGFGPAYAPGVAGFNGPFMSAFVNLLPDLTTGQMHRLNDSSFVTNVVIGRQQSRAMVAFLPQALFMDTPAQKRFWKEPLPVLLENQYLKFLKVKVDGMHILELDESPPVIGSVEVPAAEMTKFQGAAPAVKGYLIGQFLNGAEIRAVDPPVEGLKIVQVGRATQNRLEFQVEAAQPVPPGTVVHVEVLRGKHPTRTALQVAYTALPPSLLGMEPASRKPEDDTPVILKGANFLPGATKVVVSGDGVQAVESSIRCSEPTELSVQFRIAKTAARGPREVRVVTPGGTSGVQKLEIVED